MVKRNELPIWIYIILLGLILIASFIFSGVFSFPDTGINNLSEKFVEVCFMVYKPWVWVNEKTPACLGCGFILWIFMCSYLMYHYRNFQNGIEYGSAEWADPKDVTKRRTNPDGDNRILSFDTKIATSGPNAPSNNNMIVVGSSGTYKTTSIVTPNLLRCGANYIVLDVKGELMYKYGLYLKKQGYTIRCLNIKDPNMSDRYNPFEYIETELDLIKLIENIYESLTPPDSNPNDPFWEEGPKLYLQSLFYYEWERAKMAGETGCFNNVLTLVNDEATPVGDGKDKKRTRLLEKMDQMAADYKKRYNTDTLPPAVRDYRKLKEGAADTVRSIIVIVNAKLKLCETQGLQRIFETDDMGLRDFATGVGGSIIRHPDGRIEKSITMNKLAIFLCVNDNDTSLNFVCSMLYSQALEILCRMADYDFKEKTEVNAAGALPIPLELWMDEFYAGARPKATEQLMGTVRSRNISLIPILQSITQLQALYSGDKYKIMYDNAPVFLFLGAGEASYDSHEYISNLLGKMTIDTANDGKNGFQYSHNYQRTGRELMTPAEVKDLNTKECIIFIQGEKPIRDYKALPWELPNSECPFNEAMEMNDKHPDKGFVLKIKEVIDPFGRKHRQRDTGGDTPLPVGSSLEELGLTDEKILKADLSSPSSDIKSQIMQFHSEKKERVEKSIEVAKRTAEPFRDRSLKDVMRSLPKMEPKRQRWILRAFQSNMTDDEIKEMLFIPEEMMEWFFEGRAS